MSFPSLKDQQPPLIYMCVCVCYHNSLSNSDSWTVNFEVSALWTYVDYVSSQKDSWAATFLFWYVICVSMLKMGGDS